jgi:hypothetical protein
MLLANHLTQLAWAQALSQGGMGRQTAGFHRHPDRIKGE